ncbi:MAG: tRNA (adenosine(37)-N6)-threonylcarbamoyltransferase complex dimerization subunit type 1 TsaB [Nitrospira sp.]|nr:tRNA (adenosine(37)-N6)-threonylcarbamoyltransferase complex dimerization subunit type 1 TsaB [Nitrospira sp.]
MGRMVTEGEAAVKLLAVETATRRQSVAILDGTTVLCQSNEETGLSHAKWLVPTIDRLLQSSSLTLSALDGFAVSIGPGSFTGLRVGLATVMGFRMVTGLPLVTVPTLEAMAWNLRAEDRPLCPVLKARAGEVYWAFYRWKHAAGPTRLTEERVGSLESLARSIQGPTVMLGEGWVIYQDELRRLMGTRSFEVSEAPPDALAASAVSVGLAGLERLARGEIAGRGIAPLYVQRVEAEVKVGLGLKEARMS